MPWIRNSSFALGLIALGACTSSKDTQPEASEDAGQEIPSVWEFISEKYDADQDAVVSQEEYREAQGELRSLDRNGDGQLSADDFDEAAILSSFDRSRRAQFSLLEYFQDDEEALNLTREECRRSAVFYDQNDDGFLTKLEFREKAAARHRNLLAPDWMPQPEKPALRVPWAELRGAIDVDRDKRLSLGEIDRFFMDNASGREVWNAERYLNFPLKPGYESLTGPRLGEMAPDFTLSPSAGGDDVTLSAFRGERPVALIFGSYT